MSTVKESFSISLTQAKPILRELDPEYSERRAQRQGVALSAYNHQYALLANCVGDQS